MKMQTVAIIGAGISGLSCARALSTAGLEVAIFEKSRSLGGRCATRKWEGHIVDHGAQYFTMRDEAFEAEVRALCAGQLRNIDAPVLNVQGRAVAEESARWYHSQGNNRLGRCLAGDLRVQLETTVSKPELRDGKWRIAGSEFDAIVSSAPWPQTLALLGREISTPTFAPCLTALFSYDGQFAGNSSLCYARVDRDGALSWSSCENHKTGRIADGQTVFVAQASPKFSLENLEADPARWEAELQKLLEENWELPLTQRRAAFTHRWRFARYLENADIEGLPPGFFVTGDVRTESRVESAWIAGRQTARDMLVWLNGTISKK